MELLTERTLTRLELPLVLLLALGLAWSLATGIWFFIGGAETDVQVATVRADEPEVEAAGGPALPAAAIAALDLFGTPDAAGMIAPAAADAPETRLQLELNGVFLAQTAIDSSAIVAERNRDGKLYRVGDRLPGNAELTEVLADRIVLRRAGQYETLRFPNASDALSLADMGSVGTIGAGRSAAVPRGRAALQRANLEQGDPYADAYGENAATAAGMQQEEAQDNDTASSSPRESMRETLERFQQSLDVDPQGTLAQIGVEPVVTDGGAGGYRIGNEIPAARLSSVGLRPGDVVLSVNGRAVGDIEQDRGELQAIVDAGSARLEIQRDDRRFFVTTRLQ